MDSLPIQSYDIFILVILILATAFGAWKGMAWQLASIASVVVSSIVAMRFSHQAVEVLPFLNAEEPWSRFVAIGLLFLGTSLGVWLIFRLVAGMIDRVKLKEFDRQAGALFGLAKGILFALILTFFAVTLSERTRQLVLNSMSGKYAAILVQKGTPMMPQDVRQALGKYIEEFDRKLDPNTPPDEPSTTMATSIGQGSDAGQGGTLLPGFLDTDSSARPPAWDPELWGQDASRFANENLDAATQRLNAELDAAGSRFSDAAGDRLDQLGRQIETLPSNVSR